jgi:hypothetical protein
MLIATFKSKKAAEEYASKGRRLEPRYSYSVERTALGKYGVYTTERGVIIKSVKMR